MSRTRLVILGPVLLVLVFGSLITWELCARSTIPLELSGEVTAINVRSEDAYDAWFVQVEEEVFYVDAAVGKALDVGDQIHKAAWETTISVDGTDVPLAMGAEARAALWFTPALILGSLFVSLMTFRQHGYATRTDPTPSRLLHT